MDVGSVVNTTGSGSTTTATKNAQDTQDRFLKLLVAQMQNQDPMNPMDNAQVTTQMAQIQTVSGISTLDTSLKALSSQMAQTQALQSASLIGRDVTIEGNRLKFGTDTATGVYQLDGAADRVKLEVLSPAGSVIDTVELGAQSKGMQEFSWPMSKAGGNASLNYRITATSGTAAVTSTTYSQDKVEAINISGSKALLQLSTLGTIDYSKIVTID
ncbi:flagellar hook capping FlgD N-terminal domain-containing protein [Pelomonas sp. SE-A7]|uniref:flagellar hook assembly protein FlgD n=1 Tax=Pelomonas sp. SE-A7 TaxID=3054953 RepID=UPI00259CD111|nr:flagellar hook capping FlgD N-terminal domain-containing protein [Pelomonas sp. SE-A7]MDM4764540.1 flagellar hook capping FlgD N-terminal domain-containing protein [Pelomonas sp. SE-A7]